MTALDLIKRALRLLGVLSVGETVEDDLANNALIALNSMLDSWAIEALTIYQVKYETFSLTSGVATYTIGTGGVFNTDRPDRIQGGYVSLSGSDYPFTVISPEQWNEITFKSITSTWPSALRYDASVPLGVINLYPVPNGGTITLNAYKALQNFSAITDVVVLPRGYDRAITYNLAIELAPEYQTTVTPEVAKIARDSKASIQMINAKRDVLELDSAFAGRQVQGNILSGFY